MKNCTSYNNTNDHFMLHFLCDLLHYPYDVTYASKYNGEEIGSHFSYFGSATSRDM